MLTLAAPSRESPPTMELNEGNWRKQDLAAAVSEAGWVRFSAQGDIEASLLKVGGKLNAASEKRIESLRPRPEGAGPRNSLTAKHGLSPFPLHTDGAHLIEPPRFVVLACASPGGEPAPTVLVRFKDLNLDEAGHQCLRSAPFLFRNGRRSFYSTICAEAWTFIRFDEGCMRPLDLPAAEAITLVTEHARHTTAMQIDWRAGDVLIIDNWQVLHGRGLARNVSPDRHLLRMSIS